MSFGEGSLGQSIGMSGVVGAQNLCLGHMVLFVEVHSECLEEEVVFI